MATIAFLHQNMPGQFKHLAPALAQDGHRVLFMTQRRGVQIAGVEKFCYKPRREVTQKTHPYLVRTERAVLNGQQTARAFNELRANGVVPDLVIAHPGWGEALYVKDVLPHAQLISFCEFFYGGNGLDVGFDPESPSNLNSRARARSRSMHLLSSLEACDVGVAPTAWQRQSHPAAYRDKIELIFDGIDIDRVRPNYDARFELENGVVLRRGDPVITYVARNLEPYRGFRTFMRAIPKILERNREAQILIVGGDARGYGDLPEGFASWREALTSEVQFDPRRVHFLGMLPYDRYLSVLAISAAHVYLTYPFVLSWSCVEAMATGVVLIGSDTPPVREFVEHKRNGLLVDFFDAEALAEQVSEVLSNPAAFAPLAKAARQTVVDGYSRNLCLNKWRDLIAQRLSISG